MRCFSHLLSILPKNYFKKYKKRNIVNIQEDAKTLIVISLLLKVVHLRQRLDNAVSSSRDRSSFRFGHNPRDDPNPHRLRRVPRYRHVKGAFYNKLSSTSLCTSFSIINMLDCMKHFHCYDCTVSLTAPLTNTCFARVVELGRAAGP